MEDMQNYNDLFRLDPIINIKLYLAKKKAGGQTFAE
jgi:hypothetical protein